MEYVFELLLKHPIIGLESPLLRGETSTHSYIVTVDLSGQGGFKFEGNRLTVFDNVIGSLVARASTISGSTIAEAVPHFANGSTYVWRANG